MRWNCWIRIKKYFERKIKQRMYCPTSLFKSNPYYELDDLNLRHLHFGRKWGSASVLSGGSWYRVISKSKMPVSDIFVLLTGLRDLKDSLNSLQNRRWKRLDKSTRKLLAPCYSLQQRHNMRYDVIQCWIRKFTGGFSGLPDSLSTILNATMSHVLRKLL